MSRVTHLLIHRANLARLDRVEAGPGRWTDTPVVVAADVACRVHGVTGRDAWYAQQLQVKATHVGYFEPGTDVRIEDTLTPTIAPGFVGKTFTVTAVAPPSIDHHVKALLEEIQHGG